MDRKIAQVYRSKQLKVDAFYLEENWWRVV